MDMREYWVKEPYQHLWLMSLAQCRGKRRVYRFFLMASRSHAGGSDRKLCYSQPCFTTCKNARRIQGGRSEVGAPLCKKVISPPTTHLSTHLPFPPPLPGSGSMPVVCFGYDMDEMSAQSMHAKSSFMTRRKYHSKHCTNNPTCQNN